MSAIGEVHNMIREMVTVHGGKPSRMVVGRDFAKALAVESYEIIPQRQPIREATLEEHTAAFMRSVEHGAVQVFGVRIDAGWLNG